MQDYFFRLVSELGAALSAKEVLLCHYVGERSDFVRFNQAKVRQAMTIEQGHMSVSLVIGQRWATSTLALSGVFADDRATALRAVDALRSDVPALPEDPYLLYATEPTSSERSELGRMPAREQALGVIVDSAHDSDLVGICASGPMYRGFASSLGHRHWHAVASFQFVWSLYHSRDKAVHSSYATPRFDEAELGARIRATRETLAHLTTPPKTLRPGHYRAYLAPAAVAELIAMLNWGGVSAKAQRTKTSCLDLLVAGSAEMSPEFHLSENTAGGLAPAFDEVGFRRPARVELITGGRHAGALANPRTAAEYGIAANADNDEVLRSAEIAPGTLASDGVLAALDTGIYIGNLWYLNFSDRSNARITGMTRFATFWVEGGRIVAPLEVMRFDDTLYRMLGSSLSALTRERDWISSESTYGQRSIETSRLPGLLLGDLTFTL